MRAVGAAGAGDGAAAAAGAADSRRASASNRAARRANTSSLSRFGVDAGAGAGVGVGATGATGGASREMQRLHSGRSASGGTLRPHLVQLMERLRGHHDDKLSSAKTSRELCARWRASR